jgi:phospholipase/carboxylesterase
VSEPLDLHQHVFDPAPSGAKGAPTLLLLHGTGGDENDLVPLGRFIAADWNLLSPRGNVLENGAPRFFRRLREGVFDQEDLRTRTRELAEWIAAARGHHALSGAPLVALGYSNGANIAASLLLRYSGVLNGAILLRAMVPFDEPTVRSPVSPRVLLVSGEWDPIVPMDNARKLAEMLRASGAEVRHEVRPTGHPLDTGDARCAQEWLNASFAGE